MEEACRQEVIRLHQIIGQWLSGNIAQNDEAFAPFKDALTEDFQIVHPTGATQDKRGVVSGLWQAHGARTSSFRIEIRNTVCRFISESCCLLTYEEWQYDSEIMARLSTVLFVQSSQKNIKWHHLHETWLPHTNQTDISTSHPV